MKRTELIALWWRFWRRLRGVSRGNATEIQVGDLLDDRCDNLLLTVVGVDGNVLEAHCEEADMLYNIAALEVLDFEWIGRKRRMWTVK